MIVGELALVFVQIVLTWCVICQCQKWTTDILWTMNKLAKAVTKWIRAYDKMLAIVIKYIHVTADYRPFCHFRDEVSDCKLGWFSCRPFVCVLSLALPEPFESLEKPFHTLLHVKKTLQYPFSQLRTVENLTKPSHTPLEIPLSPFENLFTPKLFKTPKHIQNNFRKPIQNLSNHHEHFQNPIQTFEKKPLSKPSTLSPRINTLSKRHQLPPQSPLGPPPKTCHNLFVPPQSPPITTRQGFWRRAEWRLGAVRGVEDLVCYRFSSMMRTQIPTPTRTLRTAHTLSTFLKVRGRIVKIIPSCHHCWLAVPQCNGNPHPRLDSPVTFFLTFCCVLPLRCLEEWHFYCEPTSELDMCGRFVTMVDLTHDDEDTNSRLSDIPLQLPAIATVSLTLLQLVTFSQAEGIHPSCRVFQVSIRYRVRLG